jgi:hypothetical protein
MVPDFHGFRKQLRDRTSERSLKPFDRKGFDNLKNSQQFAKQSPSNPSGEADHDFFALWTTCPSWSPILKKKDGWITIINPSGKKVPLVLGSIESHYRRKYIIGKRFSKLTNYLMIDVDRDSPFHPCNGGIEPIIEAMESIGLCRYLLIRSSGSDGLHIYFPLAQPVSAWGIACAAHAALTAAGVRVAGGICELFPNKKAFNAEHNGHRLPLQQESFILDDDFRCIGNDKALFVQHWQHCTAGQDNDLLADVLTEKPLPIPKQISVSSLPPIAWTGPGQSNEVMKELVNYGDRYLGLKTIPALGDWISAVAPQLPGFEQFASEESRNDLTRKNWAYRWAKSHFKSVRQYAAKSSFDHNAMVAAEALERLKVALNKIVIIGTVGIKKLWKALSKVSKELFGVGFSWGLFQKHRKLILAKISSACNGGLSKEAEEGKNSSSPELATPLDSETENEPKNHLTELLTARCVTTRVSQNLSASRTPSERVSGPVAETQQKAVELAMGTVVKVQQPRSDVDSIQTRVTGKVTDENGKLLYRLEHCVEGQPLMLPGDGLVAVSDDKPIQGAGGAIRATAAQLLQVLGKACPFVGPGLWTVRREEVPAHAWGHLCRLVGEG